MMWVVRSRWAAVGAAVAVSLGAVGVGLVDADVSTGERTVLVAVAPCRILDTRPEFLIGNRATPLGARETYAVKAVGAVPNSTCSIPSDAVALSLNVTAVDATLPTYLTIWATGVAKPNASSLNPAPGQPPMPNAVITELSSGGQFSIFNLQGKVHVIADVNGYYIGHDHDDRYYTRADVDARIVSPWETLPSGVTVTGNFVFDSAVIADGADHYEHVPLPARAPIGLTSADVNFAADSNSVTVDDDPTCDGTLADPTAPRGKVCIYLKQSGGVHQVSGQSPSLYTLQTDAGFLIAWWEKGTPGHDSFLHATWAYRAP